MGHLVVWSVGRLMFDGLVGWLVGCWMGPRGCQDLLEKRTSFVRTRIQTRDQWTIGMVHILSMLLGPTKFLPITGHE